MIERWSRGVRPYLLLAALCAVLYLPGIASLPVFDRDEARFAQATRQMIESGDYLRIRFQNEARNKKPAGTYWLQAASVAAFGDAASDAIWPYRLPSALGALAAVLLTFGLGRRLAGGNAALIGAALLAAGLEPTIEAHIAKTDAVLLAAAVAAQGALGILYRGTRVGEPTPWPWAFAFWTAQGLALLIKGPIVPILSALTIAALAVADRDWRWLRSLHAAWGAPVAAAIAAPWFIAINLATSGGFMAEAVGHDLLGKLAGAQEGHAAPPLAHLLVLLIGFWPATLFLGRALSHGWRERRAVAERFLIAWAVPFWILVEVTPTKLPQYLLPAYPALALMMGRALAGIAASPPPRRWFDWPSAAIWGAGSLALGAALVALPIRFGDGAGPVAIGAAAVLAALCLWLLARRQALAPPAILAAVLLCAVAVFVPLAQFIVPSATTLFVSRAADALVRAQRLDPARPVALVGYQEPSLIFLLGTATEILAPEPAADALRRKEISAVLVAAEREEAFRRALSADDAQARPAGQVSGLDYSTGKPVTLTLYRGD